MGQVVMPLQGKIVLARVKFKQGTQMCPGFFFFFSFFTWKILRRKQEEHL